MHPSTKETTMKCSYKAYHTLPDVERWEIINRNAYNVTPPPSTKQQLISVNLVFEIKNKNVRFF